jgi:hypothetical protein
LISISLSLSLVHYLTVSRCGERRRKRNRIRERRKEEKEEEDNRSVRERREEKRRKRKGRYEFYNNLKKSRLVEKEIKNCIYFKVENI